MTSKKIAEKPIVEPKNWIESWALIQSKKCLHWANSWWFLSLIFGFYLCVAVSFYLFCKIQILDNTVPIISKTILYIILFIMVLVWYFTVMWSMTLMALYQIIQRLVEKEK